MKPTALLLAALAALAAVPGTPAQNAPTTPAGRWVTESGNLEVEIAPCGDALCGAVVKVLANRSMSAPGQPMEAADPRPALGMVILSGLRSQGDGDYDGRIYNRENAKHYSARLRLGAPDQLVIRAYIGLPLFGKTQLWRRTESSPSRPATP